METDETILDQIREKDLLQRKALKPIYELSDYDLFTIQETLLHSFELMEQETGETRQHFIDRQVDRRSLIAVLSEVIGQVHEREEEETVIFKITFSGGHAMQEPAEGGRG